MVEEWKGSTGTADCMFSHMFPSLRSPTIEWQPSFIEKCHFYDCAIDNRYINTTFRP